MVLRPLAPQASAYTNSATSALCGCTPELFVQGAAGLTEIVQFGPTDLGSFCHFDLRDRGCVNGKDALDTDPLGYFAYRDRFIDRPAATLCNDETFKDLQPFLACLLDFLVDADRLPGLECGQVSFQLLLFEIVEGVHTESAKRL